MPPIQHAGLKKPAWAYAFIKAAPTDYVAHLDGPCLLSITALHYLLYNHCPATLCFSQYKSQRLSDSHLQAASTYQTEDCLSRVTMTSGAHFDELLPAFSGGMRNLPRLDPAKHQAMRDRALESTASLRQSS